MYITDLQDEDFEIAIKVIQKTHKFVKNCTTPPRAEKRYSIGTFRIYSFGTCCIYSIGTCRI
jgi:hypothetical protein